ncbi:MAG: hypothetical protein HY843_00580 [Bdellovibrio sp.]|nr:hypothetical protein [Bdellovibrio sp.]
MHILFAAARFFPFWGFMFALIFFELGRFFRRKDSKLQYSCFLAAIVFLGFVGSWFYFRGDMHSDNWIRFFFKVS